jgi:hypothetical protein
VSKAVGLEFSAASVKFPAVRKKFNKTSLFVLLEAEPAAREDDRPISTLCQFVRQNIQKPAAEKLGSRLGKKKLAAPKKRVKGARQNSEQVGALQKHSNPGSPDPKDSGPKPDQQKNSSTKRRREKRSGQPNKSVSNGTRPKVSQPAPSPRKNSRSIGPRPKRPLPSDGLQKNPVPSRQRKDAQKKPHRDASRQKDSGPNATAQPPEQRPNERLRRRRKVRVQPTAKASETVFYTQTRPATAAPPGRAGSATLGGLLLVILVALLASVYCAVSPGRRARRAVESDVELLIPNIIAKAPVNRQTEMADNVSPLDYDRGSGDPRVSFDTVA